jgi:hypothetical protein
MTRKITQNRSKALTRIGVVVAVMASAGGLAAGVRHFGAAQMGKAQAPQKGIVEPKIDPQRSSSPLGSISQVAELCEHFAGRKAFLKDYAMAMEASYQLLRVGTMVSYEVQQGPLAGPLEAFEETWTVTGLNPSQHSASVSIQRHTPLGDTANEIREHIVRVPLVPKSDDLTEENCGHPFVFANTFGSEAAHIMGSPHTVYTRKQFKVGNAEYSQWVSARVPFGLVADELVTLAGSAKAFVRRVRVTQI